MIEKIKRVLQHLKYHFTMSEIIVAMLEVEKVSEEFILEYDNFKTNTHYGKSVKEKFELLKENIVLSMVMSNQDKFDLGNINIYYAYAWYDSKKNKVYWEKI